MVTRLLTNARIYTLDKTRPQATAALIVGNRIAAVGGDELRTSMPQGTIVNDLGGRVVIPGLTDAHIHWEWTARNLQRVILMDITTKTESIAKVKAFLPKVKAGEWLVGFGWSQGMWTDTKGDFPSAADLDPLSSTHPIYLKARSGHAGWANSRALELAGITAKTPDPPGGAIQRDAAGNPTGILFEDACDLVTLVIPKAPPEDVAAAMLEAQELAWRVGLTGLHDYDRELAFEAMQLLHQKGQLGLRILKHINDPTIHHAHGLGLRFGFGDDMLRIGALKIFADGALGSVTALMIEPFEEQPDNYGIAVSTKARMQELVLEATRRGLPSTIHAIGDKAVREVLDVYQAAREEEARLGIPRDARRHRIEHVQLIHPDDVHRLAELDIIASIQPIHATSDYPIADRYWGKRAALSYNARVQLDQGVAVAFGSDSPVEDYNPFAGIHAAVTRRRSDGTPGEEGWYPEARLTVEEAILGYTQGPAFAAGMEDRLGKIAPGFLADLLLLDEDPWKIPTHDLQHIRPQATMVDGKWRYVSKGLSIT